MGQVRSTRHRPPDEATWSCRLSASKLQPERLFLIVKVR